VEILSLRTLSLYQVNPLLAEVANLIGVGLSVE